MAYCGCTPGSRAARGRRQQRNHGARGGGAQWWRSLPAEVLLGAGVRHGRRPAARRPCRAGGRGEQGDSAARVAPDLARLVRRERVDVINGHLGNGTAAAVAAGLLTGVGVVGTMHFIAPRHTNTRTAPLQRPVYRAMLRRLDAIIAVS